MQFNDNEFVYSYKNLITDNAKRDYANYNKFKKNVRRVPNIFKEYREL